MSKQVEPKSATYNLNYRPYKLVEMIRLASHPAKPLKIAYLCPQMVNLTSQKIYLPPLEKT